MSKCFLRRKMVFLISLMKLSLGRSLLSLCYSTHQISSEVEYHRSYIVYFSGPVEEKKIFINTYLVIVQMIITHYYNKPLVKYHKHKIKKNLLSSDDTYTELHVRYFLFLFIAQVDFTQEYTYHSTCGLFYEDNLFLLKVNIREKTPLKTKTGIRH